MAQTQTSPGRIVVPGAFDGVQITPHGVTGAGLPYPENTDPVMAGADAIKALAQAVDPLVYREGWSRYVASRQAKIAAGGSGFPGLVSWPLDPGAIGGAINMVSGRLHLVSQLVKAGTRIDGVAYLLTTPGQYTASNSAKIGAYTYSGTQFMKVAESVSDPNIWRGTAGFRAQPFTTAYTPSADTILWAASVANWSAVTTNPQLTGMQAGIGGVFDLGLSQGGSYWGASTVVVTQADLPSAIANASASLSAAYHWLSFYHQY